MIPRLTTRSATAMVSVVIAAGILACGQAKPAAETWYHTSDVAKLATTGRPQLVEFFHPD